MATINLPGGHTADIRDPADVRRGDVRFVSAAMDKDMAVTGNQQGGMQVAGGLLGTATSQDAVVFRFLRSWTLTMRDLGDDDDRPAPITLEVVQDLPLKFYRPLAAALLPALQEIMGAGEAMTNGEPDPLSVARLSTSAPTD